MKNSLARKIIIISFVFSFLGGCLFIVLLSAASEFEASAAAALGEEERQTLPGDGGEGAGKAEYVGTDEAATEFSNRILMQVLRWNNKNNPYYNGYRGLCEKWCYDVYTRAGYMYKGSCCAYSHGKEHALTSGKVPKGALIFSGQKPDGTYYENGRRPSSICKVCGHYPGHVGIYVGDGKVAGSQVPYIYDIDTWIETFGYGGYSIS